MNARRILPIVLAAVLVLMLSQPVLAAFEGYGRPKPESKVPWAGILYLLVSLAGICAVAFKNPRRTHLD